MSRNSTYNFSRFWSETAEIWVALDKKSTLHWNIQVLDTKSRGFLIFSESLQIQNLHTLEHILECVHILQNMSKLAKDTRCHPGIASLHKCSPETTCKCLPEQRKHFNHTANLLWAISWFWYPTKQVLPDPNECLLILLDFRFPPAEIQNSQKL